MACGSAVPVFVKFSFGREKFTRPPQPIADTGIIELRIVSCDAHVNTRSNAKRTHHTTQ